MKSVSLLAFAFFIFAKAQAQCPVISITSAVNDASCYNYKNGSVNITVSGGTAPYTYKWSNLTTSEDMANLYAGDYTVLVTDANGCTATKTVSVGQPNEILMTSTALAPSCARSSNGSILPSASGGTPPYTFSQFNGSGNLAGLAAGTYELLATDSRGCIGRQEVSLVAPAPIQIFSISSKKYLGYDLSCAGSSDGEITIDAAGGTGSLQYAVSGGQFQSSPVISGLAANTYVISVKDENGCVLSNDIQSMIANPGIVISPPITLLPPAPMQLSPITVNPWQLLGGFPNVIYQGYGPQWVVLSAGDVTGGTGNTFSYLWTNNTGAPLSHPTENMTQTTPTQTTTYTLTVTDRNGCQATSQVTIRIVDARCVQSNSNNQNQKILMCHNGTDICVSTNSLSMSQHLAHGDKIGPCSFVNEMTGISSRRIDGAGSAVNLALDNDILEVHPNPAAGRFQVKMQQGPRTEIQVVDASGIVIERRMGGSKALETFDLSGRPAGLYYIKTISAEGVRSVKLWIRR